MEWIKCSERMPDKKTDRVLIYDNGNIYTADTHMIDNDPHYFMIDTGCIRRASHWMPLPPEPSKKE